MEFLRNEIVKFLLKIFLAMCVLDVLSRTILNTENFTKEQKTNKMT